ncbi:MAG: ABC transporter permease [Candidatus Caldatribacteriota bacterium]|nr:ABC transporter permease [Candidatus Caldatribacteriota bacterium]
MLKYLIKRLMLFVIVIFGVVTVTFFLSHVIPADPVGAIIGENAPQELVEKMEKELGLDLPVGQQYIRYLKGIVHWDFGMSLRTQRPVSHDMRIYFPATMELALFSLSIAIIFGIIIGIISAVKRNQLPDNISRVFSLVGISMPAFWLGLLFILILYYHLGLIPAGGRLSPSLSSPPIISGFYLLDSLIAGEFRTFWDALYHLIGPGLVLGWIQTAYICRVTRSSMLEVLNEEYIRTARVKGLKEKIVIFRHAFKNALIPVVTMIGISFGYLLEGSVLTETVFGYPGLGRYAVNSFLSLDLNSVIGSVTLIAICYALSNLIVDLLYAFLDPRIKY